MGKMPQREKLLFVYDADGSIGVVMEFSEVDFEAYSMPDLALVGTFQTKAQAAQALATRTHQFMRCRRKEKWPRAEGLVRGLRFRVQH
jgi:hypothetical protein